MDNLFSVLSLILFNLALFFPEQRIMILGFLTISIIFGIILFYFQKITSNENFIRKLQDKISELAKSSTERFNYLKEIYNLKVDIEMLKKEERRHK